MRCTGGGLQSIAPRGVSVQIGYVVETHPLDLAIGKVARK